MITIDWVRVRHNTLNFLQLQTFLTLIYLPILIAWGLPLSLASPLGNLIFSPILTIFLLLSSLLFFAELLSIPNEWLLLALTYISKAWLWILEFNTPTAMIGFIKPPIIILYILSACTFIIMQIRYKNWRLQSTIASAIFLTVTIIGLKYAQPNPTRSTLIMRDTKSTHGVDCLYEHGTTVIIDTSGAIGKTISAPSWVTYTLMPEIIQHTGSLTIDHFIALKPNKMLFEALTVLCTKITIKNLYLPCWVGTLNKSTWHTFFTLCTTLKKQNVNLIRLSGSAPYTLPGPIPVTIIPTKKQRPYQEALFTVYEVNYLDLQ